MTREEAIEILWRYDVDFEPHPPEEVMHAIDMAIEALQAEAVQGCEGCRHNELTPQRHCIRCRRYWKDSYERKGGDDE